MNNNVICIKELEINKFKFERGEKYKASRVNDKWWCIEAIGISENQFNLYFKHINEENN